MQINSPRPAVSPEQPPPRADTASGGGGGGGGDGGGGGFGSARTMWRGVRRAARTGACPAVCLRRGSRGTASVCVQ